MRDAFFRGVFVLIVGMFLAFSSLVRADDAPTGDGGGLSDGTKAGIGCVVASGGALLAALAAGPNELVMVAAGGTLVPSATTPLMVGLTATVFAATCSVGIAATPFVLWLSEQVGSVLNWLGGGNDAPPATTKSPN